MKTILVLGAGRSSSSLISYLVNLSQSKEWQVIVGDRIRALAEESLPPHGHRKAVAFDLDNKETILPLVKSADVIISLLPPALHVPIARLCLRMHRHLLTASYVSDEMKKLDEEARSKSLLLLNECGLDPGLDHMSAMQIIDKIKSAGGLLTSFESFTGGLIAPETDPGNPWRYKFTWNPRNVVTAGQGGAEFLKNGKRVKIQYERLFKEVRPVEVPGYGAFEGYANRDSLKYLDLYGLNDIKTMMRGTLRSNNFCSAWNVLVQLGCCDDTYELTGVESMSHYDYMNRFVNNRGKGSIEDVLIHKFTLSENELNCLRWSGFFTDERVGLPKGTPAQILEHILMKKWKLNPEDKDMIVMWHRFVYEQGGRQSEIQSSLVVKGENMRDTAMARTVGLPLGIATKLLLEGKITQKGVCIPVSKEFYEPILRELQGFDIRFNEQLIS